MTTPFARAASATVFAAALTIAGLVQAQSTGARSGGLLDDLFGGGQPSRGPAAGQVVQAPDTDLVVRIDRLESYIRQLTGAIEQLQFRNQQLEQALRKMQEDTDYRFQQMGGRAGPSRPAAYRRRRRAIPAPPGLSPRCSRRPSRRGTNTISLTATCCARITRWPRPRSRTS